jgi:hypothetical protein
MVIVVEEVKDNSCVFGFSTIDAVVACQVGVHVREE